MSPSTFSEDMVGHKLGEFAPTRTFRGHAEVKTVRRRMQITMEAKAYLRYVRISPRKVQIVCDLIRGKECQHAMAILMQTPKAASEPLHEAPQERRANARTTTSAWIPRSWSCTQVFATPGPILKRMMPRAQGRAYRINKRTSHVTLAVAEKA